MLFNSARKYTTQSGFTISEMAIAIVLIGIISTAIFTFANNQLDQYFRLNEDTQNFSEITTSSQRIAKVLRGLTDIINANDNELEVYAYFAPRDTVVSKIKYYKNPEGSVLYADVTPMTSNPPNGTPITAEKKTFTIMPKFYSDLSSSLFTYLDSTNLVIPTPIANQHTIKGIKINIAVPSKNPGTSTGNIAMSLQVSLRNRKTNL